MELSLFKTEPIKVSIKDVKSLDFNWFRTNTNILNDTFKEDLDVFYDIYAERDIKPCFFISSTYNTIANEKKFRFMFVTFEDNDIVFVPYKVIQIMNLKQIRIIYNPVSKNKNIEHEKLVFNVLNDFSFTKFVTTDTTIVEKTPLLEYNDYYFTLYDKKDKYQSSKYCSKNYINKLFANEDIQIEQDFGAINVKRLDSLYNAWKEGATKNGSNITKHSDILYHNIVSSGVKNLYHIIIYYKSEPISSQIFLCNQKYGYCDCLYINHLWDSNNDNVLKRILNNIVEIQKYLCFKYLYKVYDIKSIYLAGCMPDEHRLLKHKERICDSKIEHFLLNKN